MKRRGRVFNWGLVLTLLIDCLFWGFCGYCAFKVFTSKNASNSESPITSQFRNFMASHSGEAENPLKRPQIDLIGAS
jgi:hypothetical protein